MRDIDKFAAFGLTPLPAEQVKAPLVKECFANIECKVTDTRLVNSYNLFIPSRNRPKPSTTTAT